VIGIFAFRRNPGEVRQPASRDVGDELLLRRRVELVGQRLIIDKGAFGGTIGIAILGNRWDRIVRPDAAPKSAVGEIHAGMRLRGDDVLMRDKTFVELRLEHSIGQHALGGAVRRRTILGRTRPSGTWCRAACRFRRTRQTSLGPNDR
jgi:hypothetical protein